MEVGMKNEEGEEEGEGGREEEGEGGTCILLTCVICICTFGWRMVESYGKLKMEQYGV